MKNVDFVWADLSAINLEKAKTFYKAVLGWKYHAQGEYIFAYAGKKTAAGVYTMPTKFQDMGMPSFWMSYIHVPDIHQAVARAKEKNGIIEVPPTDFQGQGQVALIRDPSGAGFTVWQGDDLGGKDTQGIHGRMIQNELYVSDANLVIDFYQYVFGWTFTLDDRQNANRYTIHNADQKIIAALEVIPNEIKGKAEFWAVYFTVKDMETAHINIQKHGGSIITQMDSGQDKLSLVSDPSGAVFMLAENPTATINRSLWRFFKPLTILALGIVYMAVVFNIEWMWGLLFLLWLSKDIRSGQTYLVEPVYRATNPILYWVILLSWFWMSVYLLLAFIA